MGLSRRQFTKEFKLAALQRLEMGGSVAEVAVLEEDSRRVEPGLRRARAVSFDAEAWHTPLSYVATRGPEEIVRLLIERGAVETLRSLEGETLNEIAQKARHRDIAGILHVAAGGDEARS